MKLIKRCESLEAARNPTEEEHKAMKKWLKAGADPHQCPFKGPKWLGFCPCDTLIKGYMGSYSCPCYRYTTAEVVKLYKKLTQDNVTPKRHALIPRTHA